jgi:hypothetical protein
MIIEPPKAENSHLAGVRHGILSRLLLFITILFAIILCAVTAHSHSTEGRVRVPLDWSSPNADDFAYFIEPYVNRQKYEGQFEPYMGRFYVMDFHRVELDGRKAKVVFEVLDVRNNSRFVDDMSFIRPQKGVWHYSDVHGDIIEVFTYIPEWRDLLNRYSQPAGMIGLPVLLLVFYFVRSSKRGKRIFASKGSRLK